MTIQSLSQEEMDAEYHLGGFHAEEAMRRAVVDVFETQAPDNRKLRDELLDAMAVYADDTSRKYLGEERYAALLKRLLADESRKREAAHRERQGRTAP